MKLSATDHLDAAREIGFGQCVLALRRTLATTPLGLALLAWVAWTRAPHEPILLWLGAFAGVWLVAMWIVHVPLRAPASLARRGHLLWLVAALDGAAWGGAAWILGGQGEAMVAMIGAILCGVVAVNAPVYITCNRAFVVQLVAMWTAVVACTLLGRPHAAEREMIAGLTVFLGLLAFYMRSIAQRVLEGIRLQLSNAQLAEQLAGALQLVRQEASTDVLTGQPNRRALDAMLAQQLALARIPGRPFSVLLLDIDHFKQVNDRFGHGVGDATLRAFAQRVREYLRQDDACARYGGEEFVVVLPSTALADALDVAERLRAGVAERPLPGTPAIAATVSIGVAQYVDGESADQLLARADSAVYAAKRGGRNRVQTAEETVPA